MPLRLHKMRSPSRHSFSVLVLDLDDLPQITLSVIRALGMVPGVRVHLVSKDRRSPAKFSRWCRSFQHVASAADDSAVIAVLEKRVSQERIDVLLPIAEVAISLCSRNLAALSAMCAVTPVPTPASLDIAVDKWRFAEYLTGSGIPFPNSIHCESPDDLERVRSSLRFPVLLKPTRGQGGQGIEYFAVFDDLYARFQEEEVDVSRYLVQEFVDGYDLGCSILSWNGEVLAYTVQRGRIAGSSRFGAPSGIEFLNDRQVYESATAFPARVCWNGVMNVDLRFDRHEGKVKVLEVNPRYWRSLLGSVLAGVNFPYLACLKARNLPLPPRTYAPGRFIIENRVALKQMLQQLFHRREQEYRFDQTSLGFAARDPLPEACLLV